MLRSRRLLIATPAVDVSKLACTLIHLFDATTSASPPTGMALQKSQWRERQVAMGAQAA